MQSEQGGAVVNNVPDIIYPKGILTASFTKRAEEKQKKEKALTPEDKKYIEAETNRVKKLSEETAICIFCIINIRILTADST